MTVYENPMKHKIPLACWNILNKYADACIDENAHKKAFPALHDYRSTLLESQHEDQQIEVLKSVSSALLNAIFGHAYLMCSYEDEDIIIRDADVNMTNINTMFKTGMYMRLYEEL